MKNICKVVHEKREIVMDALFARNAENTMSPEYAHLQSVRRDYPNYIVIRRTIKRNEKKESYKGLTYEFMETYIMTHGKQEKRIEMLREFNEMRLIAECHSQAFRYPVIKSWFLENYPEVKNFGKKVEAVAEEQTEPEVETITPAKETTEQKTEPTSEVAVQNNVVEMSGSEAIKTAFADKSESA